MLNITFLLIFVIRGSVTVPQCFKPLPHLPLIHQLHWNLLKSDTRAIDAHVSQLHRRIVHETKEKTSEVCPVSLQIIKRAPFNQSQSQV